MTFNQYMREIENATRGQQIHQIILDMCNSQEINDAEYDELLLVAMHKMHKISNKEEQKTFMADALAKLLASVQ